jgi:hypothetical protein
VVAVRVVAFTKTTFVALTPPKFAVEPETNPVPLMVTAVPPAVVPEEGATPVTESVER